MRNLSVVISVVALAAGLSTVASADAVPTKKAPSVAGCFKSDGPNSEVYKFNLAAGRAEYTETAGGVKTHGFSGTYTIDGKAIVVTSENGVSFFFEYTGSAMRKTGDSRGGVCASTDDSCVFNRGSC